MWIRGLSINYIQTQCIYIFSKLEGEPPLKFRRISTLDGNNSLSWSVIGDRVAGNKRVFEESDYFLSQAYVDGFANEVPARKSPETTGERANLPTRDDATGAGVHIDGFENPNAPCADHWKALATKDMTQVWNAFKETGLFASACRHGFLLWLADMVQSGEL